jgi:hypothetical protein
MLSGFTVTPARIDRGMNLTIVANVSGGAVPLTFTYAGLPPGCAPVDLPTFPCSPSVAGTYRITVNVTDSVGARQSATVPVTVAPHLAVLATASPTAVDVGQTTVLTSSSGGTGSPPYTFYWVVGAAIFSSADANWTPSGPGAYSASLRVTDLLGQISTSNTTILVAPALSGTLGASPRIVDIGIPVTLTTRWVGGTPPEGMTFYQLPTGCSRSNGTVAICSVSTAGNYQAYGALSDSTGAGFAVSTNFTVNADPRVAAFGPLLRSSLLGSEVYWEWQYEFGTGPFTSSFRGMPPGCEGILTNATFASCRVTAAGEFVISGTVVDSFGRSANATAWLNVTEASSSGLSTGSSVWLGVGAGVAVGLVAALLLAVWVRRRRGGPGSPAN